MKLLDNYIWGKCYISTVNFNLYAVIDTEQVDSVLMDVFHVWFNILKVDSLGFYITIRTKLWYGVEEFVFIKLPQTTSKNTKWK